MIINNRLPIIDAGYIEERFLYHVRLCCRLYQICSQILHYCCSLITGWAVAQTGFLYSAQCKWRNATQWRNETLQNVCKTNGLYLLTTLYSQQSQNGRVN